MAASAKEVACRRAGGGARQQEMASIDHLTAGRRAGWVGWEWSAVPAAGLWCGGVMVCSTI
jgi:hypothetical protein